MRTAASVLVSGAVGLPLGVYLLPDKWGYLLVGFFFRPSGARRADRAEGRKTGL